MEAAYVDRYREELSDIFSKLVHIDIYFGSMKKKALADYEKGLISEAVYKEVNNATYRTVLKGDAQAYALPEDDRLLVLRYVGDSDVTALYLNDISNSFNALMEKMDLVAYSVKTYHKYYSMDIETLRASVLEMVNRQFEEKKEAIEVEMKEMLKNGEGNVYESPAYKALQARLVGLNDSQEMTGTNIMFLPYENLINFIVKRFDLNENYWNWYRVRENQENYSYRAESSLPFEKVLYTDTTIVDLNESLLSYDQVMNKLFESYQLYNQFATQVAMINNARKVIVNRKCGKKECLEVFSRFYQLPVFCDYIASYAVGDTTEINSTQVFEMFFSKHFGNAKSVDYEEFRTTLIKEVLQHYQARIDKYTKMLAESKLSLEGKVGVVRSANNSSIDSVKLLNDLTIDSIDEKDYLGDVIPRAERDRLYQSLREYFKAIGTGDDAYTKTFK